MSKFFQFLGYVFVVLVLVAGGALGYWYYQNKLAPQPQALPLAQPSPAPTEPEVIVGESVVPTPGKTDKQLIAEALAAKYSKDVNQATVTVSDNTGIYAKGGVIFSGEIGGGWWLAYKDEGEWLIVADGNGTVSCELIEPYNFPVDMVPECWREADGTLVTR